MGVKVCVAGEEGVAGEASSPWLAVTSGNSAARSSWSRTCASRNSQCQKAHTSGN